MITGAISLGGIQLDDNLILTGLETNPDIAFSVRDLLGGPNVIQIDSRDAGASLNLTAIHDGTRRQGQFCKHQIDSLKVLSKAGSPVELVHPAGTFSVYILLFDINETDEREAPQPNKKFNGSIILQEV